MQWQYIDMYSAISIRRDQLRKMVFDSWKDKLLRLRPWHYCHQFGSQSHGMQITTNSAQRHFIHALRRSFVCYRNGFVPCGWRFELFGGTWMPWATGSWTFEPERHPWLALRKKDDFLMLTCSCHNFLHLTWPREMTHLLCSLSPTSCMRLDKVARLPYNCTIPPASPSLSCSFPNTFPCEQIKNTIISSSLLFG